MMYRFEDYLLEFSDESLMLFEKHRQKSWFSYEIGGQLFAKFNANVVRIEKATITKGKSRRSRFGFWPDRIAENADIQNLFNQDLHYVGDWHTHPEMHPSPSITDKTKMLGIFRLSEHMLENMLLVIVGIAPFPEGLFVGEVRLTGIKQLTTNYNNK